MAPRTVPWLVAAAAQALAIVWLMLQLAAEPPAAKVPAEGSASAPAAAPASPGERQEAAPTSPDAAAPTAPTTEATAMTTSTAPLGTLLHGTLRLRDGSPVETAWLSLYLGSETKALARVSPSGGEYAIPGLAPGDYRLAAQSQNMRPWEQAFVVPAATADQRVDVVFERSWLLKVLLQADDGRPLHEALSGDKDLQQLAMFGPVHVVAWGSELPAVLPPTDGRETTFTLASWQVKGMGRPGRDSLPAKYAGVLELREDRAVVVAAVMRDVVLAQVPVQPGQDEVVLPVDPRQLRAQLATVRLQVVDAATNQPVPNAKVGLNDSQSWRPPTGADAEGRFEQGKLRPGRYQLTIETGDTRIAPMLAVQLPPGVVTDLGTVPVTAPFALHVQVTGLPAEARAGATLTPLGAPGPAGLQPRSDRLSVENGALKTNVWPGRYQLRLTDGTNGALLEFDTNRLGTGPLAVAVRPEPKLRVDPSQLAEPLRLVLRAASGAVVHDRWITWKVAFDVQLPAGDYRASLQSLRGASRDEQITLPAGGGNYVLR